MSLYNNFLSRNFVLELDHVTNVTIVLNETTASDLGFSLLSKKCHAWKDCSGDLTLLNTDHVNFVPA